MANIYAEQFFYSFTKMLTGLHGTIDVASSTTGVTATSINGVASAARTGTGEITITLSDPYAALVSAQFQVLSATAQDRVVQIKSVDVVTAKTVVIRLLAAATATDPASACTIEVDLMLRNSSITK